MARGITIKIGVDDSEVNAKVAGIGRKFKSAIDPATASVSSLRTSIGGLALGFTALGVAAVAAFKQVASAALQSAIAVDRQVNSLKALTGSVEQAEKRFAALVALAQKTPGLTSQLATTLDIQLRILNVTEQTINRLLPVIGKLNAISPLGDPRQFVNNLTQLITQNFERQDLKELVGQSPFAGQLIKEIFSVDNPTNAQAIRDAAKKLGIRTVEDLSNALAKAAEENKVLQGMTESLGGQFEKLQDRLNLALAPLGKELAKTLLPLFNDLIKTSEKYGAVAADVFRDNRSDILATVRSVGDLIGRLGDLIGAVFDLGAAGRSGLGGLKQEFEDLASVLAFLTDVSEGNIINRPRTLALARQQEAERAASARRARIGQGFGPFGNADTVTSVFRGPIATGGGSRASAGGGIGAGGTGHTRSGRPQLGGFGPDFGLNEAELLRHEAELARIRQSNLAVVERRAKVLAATERPAELAKFNIALQERIQLIELETLRLEENTRAQAAAALERTGRRDLQRSGRLIGAAVDRGQLTAGEAELLSKSANAEFASRLREVLAIKEKLLAVNDPLLDDLRDEIALFDQLGTSISDTERFMKGFNSQIETSGDAFDRFGQNVARAFTNVRDLFNSLKQAVLSFFNDLLGSALQNLVRGTLGSLFGGGGGSGIGNFFRSAFGSGGGGGAPPSVSLPGIPGLSKIFGSGGSSGAIGGASSAAGGGFSFGALGSSFAAAAPLLGLSLGAGLGGKSIAGNILGAIGGGAAGIGASFGASIFGAGGGLGQAALAALGPAALIGIPLLIGSFFLGRAKQRRSDEQSAGQMLTQALAAITQLKSGIASDQIDGGQARAIFDNEILAQFVSGISSLKTGSVKKSRLTNQVADLRKNYDQLIPPEIAAQAQRRFVNTRLIPEFATGGLSRGGLAILHPREMVLTLQQQANIARLAGPTIFKAAGVPGVQRNAQFDNGGVMPLRGQDFVIENLTVVVTQGTNAQTQAFVIAAQTPQGKRVQIKNIKVAQANGEL